MRQQRPNRPCILVRQGDRRDVLVTSGHEPLQPRIDIGLVFSHPNDCSRSMNEKGALIRVSPLADAQEFWFPAGGMLPGNDTEPSGQLAAVLEALRIADGRHQGACRHRTHAGNLRQLLTRLMISVPSLDFELQFADLLVQHFEGKRPAKSSMN